ncbi:hypothetical protein JVT61DRAFT_10878 [Boletus reticuloceps]|uniref:Uncharacterized protein n=1 Tax=Boletus reticuloceps TaxID=495285 RepID=A0A8I2YFF2_9AGAM|nr:hypothetical protein JVT61DRAFT_10878 [Boletus reticuloceps]
MFLATVCYVLGYATETFIPAFRLSHPGVGQHPFNKKECAFVIIMAGAAANASLATEVLAVRRLYHNITPNAATSIFLLLCSQLLGYGVGGALRREFASIGYHVL